MILIKFSTILILFNLMTAVHSENNNEYFHEMMIEAKKGDMYAQEELGRMFEEGSDDAVKNEINAMKWYLKSAEQGLDSAQYALGKLHYRGRLYNKGGNDFYSYKEAVKWLTESAKQGYTFSQITLGDIYSEGRGINENEKEAFKWYLKAANNPPYNSMAFLPVGKRYYIGSGVDKDYKEAIKWLTKAIDSDDGIGVDAADAKYVLGVMINNGHGIEIADLDERDKKSVSLFIEAADIGHKNSYALLKRFANEENNAQSQLYLAQKHYSGYPKLSIDEDLDIAYSWYLKAANNGNSDAQYALGAMYLNGEGIAEDIFSAHDWIKEAANNGNLEAKFKIKEVTLLKQKAEIKHKAELKRQAEIKRKAELKRQAELQRLEDIKDSWKKPDNTYRSSLYVSDIMSEGVLIHVDSDTCNKSILYQALMNEATRPKDFLKPRTIKINGQKVRMAYWGKTGLNTPIYEPDSIAGRRFLYDKLMSGESVIFNYSYKMYGTVYKRNIKIKSKYFSDALNFFVNKCKDEGVTL
jgi:TPR repeat protein